MRLLPLHRERPNRQEARHEEGNILISVFLLLLVIAALVSSNVLVVQKNSRQSVFFDHLGQLKRYADSGVNLAIHELRFGVGLGDGMIGTEMWTPADDTGRDGMPATGDEGEGDGIPTPGEGNLRPVPCGPPSLG